jgi:hypothetical protein
MTDADRGRREIAEGRRSYWPWLKKMSWPTVKACTPT